MSKVFNVPKGKKPTVPKKNSGIEKDGQESRGSVSQRLKFKQKSWYANRYQLILVQRNILLLFALFSMVTVSSGMIFLNHVVSSKSLEPYVIEIEEKTGIPTVVDQVSVEELTGNELMKKYFINKFLHASTGYNPRTYPGDADMVRALSSPGVYSSFRSRIKPRSLGTSSKITVAIKSIQFPNENTVLIRILKSTRREGGTSSAVNEILTLGFYFNTSIKLSKKDRLLNPLGFQVRSYNVTEEMIDY